MAFWTRGEDPWDVDPEKARERREREPLENPLDTLREWNEKRKAEAAEKEARLAAEPPEKCPWCGKDMERGYLISGKGGITWTPGRMTTRSAWIGPPKEVRDRRLRVDDEGDFISYKTAWHCPDCQKMTLDTAGMKRPGEEYTLDLFPWETEPEEAGNDGGQGEEKT